MECKLQRIGHIAVVYNDQLLIWGGYKESRDHYDEPPSKYYDPQDISLYNPVTGTWTSKTTTGQVPPSNSGACGVIVGDSLFVYGGYFGDPDFEGNTNNIYQLNLINKIWARLEPTGHKPLHRDKLFGWEYNNKVYFFGGFGTPPVSGDRCLDHYQYISDNSHNWFMGRGWNNQLVAYNIDCNEWEWPLTTGQPPCPRAALAGFKSDSENKVYIFGGRLQRTRMNDLYALDLTTMRWSTNLNADRSYPRGRSWHSFTAISPTRAVLFGGLTTEGEVLSDCWMYNSEDNSWTELHPKQDDKRVWHQGVHIDNELIIVGGVKTNISATREPVEHAKQLLVIPSAPKSLLRLSLETCVKCTKVVGESSVAVLPRHLQSLIRSRRKAVY